jgi:hypothetical protein
MPQTPLEGRKADEVPFALAWAVWQLQDDTCLHIVLALWYSGLEGNPQAMKDVPVDLVTCVT